MKSSLLFMLAAFSMLASFGQKEDKSKRKSPPATLNATLSGGAVIRIDYSQPSVNGRTIGDSLEPKVGVVWRVGANEATVFETSKDIKVEGQSLPAGKYGLFMISGPDEWTVIFNKTWNQWGAFDYKEADDVLRVKVKPEKAKTFAEKMTFTYNSGSINLLWGEYQVSFHVE